MSKVYEYVTESIMERLGKGTVPWHKPWKNGAAGAPMNFASKKHYRGINVFLLTLQSFESPYWLTWRQVHEKGGEVRKGERSTIVVFWKPYEKEDEKNPGRTVKIPILRYYRVFNVEQSEGVEYPKSQGPTGKCEAIAAAERVAAGYPNPPEILHRGSRACYRPLEDRIFMPLRESFENPEEYYSTLFHEMTHSTGHRRRLGRKTLVDLCPFGSTNYSKEELVAEMGAAMLCGESGIENRTIDNSASYIASWLSKLRGDKRLVIQAAAQAQKAADHVMGRTFEEKEAVDEPARLPKESAA